MKKFFTYFCYLWLCKVPNLFMYFILLIQSSVEPVVISGSPSASKVHFLARYFDSMVK
mgnify:CR=1 FL=1